MDKERRETSVMFHARPGLGARTLYRCPNCTRVLGVKFDTPREDGVLVHWGAAQNEDGWDGWGE